MSASTYWWKLMSWCVSCSIVHFRVSKHPLPAEVVQEGATVGDGTDADYPLQVRYFPKQIRQEILQKTEAVWLFIVTILHFFFVTVRIRSLRESNEGNVFSRACLVCSKLGDHIWTCSNLFTWGPPDPPERPLTCSNSRGILAPLP